MNIHIKNIPFKWKEQDLRTLFEQYGEVVSAKIVMNHLTRQSKGYGFVEMIDDISGKISIENLNNTDVLGRNIEVNESLKRGDDFISPDRERLLLVKKEVQRQEQRKQKWERRTQNKK